MSYQSKYTTAEEAVKLINSGDRVYIHSVAAAPQPLINAMTARAHVHYVVTEYGVANLYGKNLHQRARALIDIAHPDHRESLEKAARERFNQFE